MGKIDSYEAIDVLNDNDVTIYSVSGITKKVSLSNLVQSILNKIKLKGLVTRVTAGVGLSGGIITSEGTIKCNLKSETKASYPSQLTDEVGRQYAVGLDSNGHLSVNVPWSGVAYSAGEGITISNNGTIKVKLDNTNTSTSKTTAATAYALKNVYDDSVRRDFSNVDNVIQVKSLTVGTREYNSEVGEYSVSEGFSNIAKGQYSHVEGGNNVANAKASHTEGISSSSDGIASHAENLGTNAQGKGSHAEGYRSQSIGDYSHAEGVDTQATAYASHSEGESTIASGIHSHAEGTTTEAIGMGSHAEGEATVAKGADSHTEGFDTCAHGDSGHAEGIRTESYMSGSHSEGNGVSEVDNYWNYVSDADKAIFANIDNMAYSIVANGNGAHAEGNCGKYTFVTTNADGTKTDGDTVYGIIYAGGEGAHAEGVSTGVDIKNKICCTIANGNGAHAEGVSTQALKEATHSEGYRTQAKGRYSHAEGYKGQALGESSHVEGSESKAQGHSSHAEGYGTNAQGSYSHAGGYQASVAGNSQFGMQGYGNKFGLSQYRGCFGFQPTGTLYTKDTTIAETTARFGCGGTINNGITVVIKLSAMAMYALMMTTYYNNGAEVENNFMGLISTSSQSNGTPYLNDCEMQGLTDRVSVVQNNQIAISTDSRDDKEQIMFHLIRII